MLKRAAVWVSDDFKLFLRRFDVARRWFRGLFMYTDPRTAGLLRIVIGLLLAGDCLRHWWYAERYYSSAGVLKNDWLLYRPAGEHNFSVFTSFSTVNEVHVAFALSLLCYVLMAVGYKTRLFTILSCIWVTSMDNRMLMVENGGYIVVNLVTFWLIWMPSGQRFSIDSLQRSWREDREGTLDDLNEHKVGGWLTEQYHSFLSFLIVANFGLVYIFNVVNKYGSTWRAGETVHYVLHLDRMVTGIAVFFREALPFWATVVMTHAVLIIEAMIVMCIFWPRNRRHSRLVAIVLVTILHIGFGTLMRLGPFAWFMIGWSVVLLMSVHWEMLENWYRRRVDPVELAFEVSNGFAWWLCRLLKRFDRADLLTFTAKQGGVGLLRAGPHEGRKAWWSAIRVLPGGKWLAPVARVLSLGLLDVWFWLLDRNGAIVARFFGLRPPAPSDAAADRPVAKAQRSPLGKRAHKWTRRARELALVWLFICAVSQVINENKSIPKPIKHKQPKVMMVTVQYLRIFQGWGMFAPNPIRDDGTVAVDAITSDGRHVDPFTGTTPDLNISDARGLGLGQIPQDYFNRIRLDRNRNYRRPLEDWIRRYHKRTGRAEDEVVFFNVYWLTDRNPLPHEGLEPTEHARICIASWRKSNYRPAKGQKGLPKRCKVASAGK
jgi:hypothetical protein